MLGFIGKSKKQPEKSGEGGLERRRGRIRVKLLGTSNLYGDLDWKKSTGQKPWRVDGMSNSRS